MKGGATRMTITPESDLPPPPPPPPSPQNSIQNAINNERSDEAEHDQRRREKEPMNDGEDAATDYDEDEDYEDADQSGENDGDEQRPILADDFYEIEAVRKKRIWKGEPQYLIKWRGWPEATNTWEPLENLVSCPDLIQAFEQSLRDGKQRSNRKYKRKHSVAPTTQSKKKQKQASQQSSPPASYDIPTVRLTIIEEPLQVPSVPDANFSNGTENNGGGTGDNGTTNLPTDTGLLMVSTQIEERQERNELDARPTEVPSSSNQDSLREFAIHIQEGQPTEGVNPVEVRPADGILNVDGTEPMRVGPLIGARRRKSFAVKRFKKEPNPALENDALGNTTGDGGVVGEDVIRNINGLDSNNIVDASPSICDITKIIKPVNCSTSIINDTKEVSVSFLVKRSDGEEVVVDNKYLKENNPILVLLGSNGKEVIVIDKYLKANNTVLANFSFCPAHKKDHGGPGIYLLMMAVDDIFTSVHGSWNRGS